MRLIQPPAQRTLTRPQHTLLLKLVERDERITDLTARLTELQAVAASMADTLQLGVELLGPGAARNPVGLSAGLCELAGVDLLAYEGLGADGSS